MRICTDIHLLASGDAGFDLTAPRDCNVWAIGPADELGLFDSGAGDVDAMFAIMRTDGLSPEAIRTLYLTHGHADHSAGAAEIARRLPHAEIVAGPRTAGILGKNDERLISLDKARGRIYPDDYVWQAPHVDRVLYPGDADRPGGGLDVRLLETPGHSGDHCSYLVRAGGRDMLVAGDALFAGGRVVLQDIEDCSVTQTLATIRALAALTFEVFLPGHGRFSLCNGKRHVDAAMSFADRLVPPPPP